MKKIVFIISFIISFACSGQNNFKLGNNTVLINKGIIFSYKTPLPPFQNEEESYSLQGNSNLVSAFYARTPDDNIVALQIYATTLPTQYKDIDWDTMIYSSDNQKIFSNSFLRKNSENNMSILNYEVKTINGKVFLEIQSTSTVLGLKQKQVNWITIYKNTFVNILGVTLLNNFDDNLSFFKEFVNSVSIK